MMRPPERARIGYSQAGGEDWQVADARKATWALVSRLPSFLADNGVVSASDQGLHVQAADTSPLTRIG